MLDKLTSLHNQNMMEPYRSKSLTRDVKSFYFDI